MLHAAVALSLLLPALPVPVSEEPLVTVVDDTRGPSRERYRVPADTLPRGRAAVPAKATPPVGTVRSWLGLDDADGSYYRKNYTLRGSGRYIEVWVADDLAFPAGDCRSGDATVTDAQVNALVHEFDSVIYPKETAAFSTPPDRDGTDPVVSGDFTGDGDKTVTLVDNVRDDNFYDFPATATYISGFFSEQLNDLFDRNVMTVDA